MSVVEPRQPACLVQSDIIKCLEPSDRPGVFKFKS